MISSSDPIIIDTTSPISGDAYDGVPGQATLDIDFQEDISIIHAYWNDFVDPDSPYITYQWGIGTCPYCTNIMSYTHVGHSTGKLTNSIDLHVYSKLPLSICTRISTVLCV